MQAATGEHAPGAGPGTDHRNDFDALRLAAAVAVIVSHAFLLTTGTEDGEPLKRLTQGQCSAGVAGVFMFFIISGYLVSDSLARTGSVPRFLAKRLLRIYPGLAVCLVLLALLLGPALTVLAPSAYFAEAGTWRFIAANLAMNTDINGLPGLRFTGFDFGTVVNGPLWSLPAELAMYLMVAALGAVRLMRLPVLVFLLAVGLACLGCDTARSDLLIGTIGWLLPFFAAGMIGWRLDIRRWLRADIALAALLGLVAAARFGGFIPLFPILGGYLTLYLAFCRRAPALPAALPGDLSYGLYIYGWPVEQSLLRLAGLMPWWQLAALALPASALIAWLSWHLVERPALRLKPAARAAAPSNPLDAALPAR